MKGNWATSSLSLQYQTRKRNGRRVLLPLSVEWPDLVDCIWLANLSLSFGWKEGSLAWSYSWKLNCTNYYDLGKKWQWIVFFPFWKTACLPSSTVCLTFWQTLSKYTEDSLILLHSRLWKKSAGYGKHFMACCCCSDFPVLPHWFIFFFHLKKLEAE